MKEIILILDNIRSVHNVGSIFRTAEGAGVSKIYCVGTTPTPLDRFGRKRRDFAKVSLGSEDMLKWEYAEHGLNIVKRFKKEGYRIIALEQSPDSMLYKKVKKSDKNVLILGNEVEGVSKDLLKQAHIIAEIPMNGQKESLNVSVSAGIALYGIFS